MGLFSAIGGLLTGAAAVKYLFSGGGGGGGGHIKLSPEEKEALRIQLEQDRIRSQQRWEYWQNTNLGTMLSDAQDATIQFLFFNDTWIEALKWAAGLALTGGVSFGLMILICALMEWRKLPCSDGVGAIFFALAWILWGVAIVFAAVTALVAPCRLLIWLLSPVAA